MKKNRILIISQLLVLVFLSACTNDDDALLTAPEEGVDQSYREVLNVTKDKAKYNPGEEVNFTVNGSHPNTVVRYKSLGKVIAEESLSATSWSWTPPADDFRGYMVELVKTTDGEETVLGTVAVDVSSDWTRFPRYGFLSEFGNVPAAQRNRVLNNLKDFHINGLQYYDWHDKHHIPLPTDDMGNPHDSWTDLFNRPVDLATIEGYIEAGHERNMASMFYNLLFGVWNADPEDNVKDEWLMYKDRFHNNADRHGLGDFGDILLTDPANKEWQEYIFNETAIVYENLNFDGWHLDQLGDRGRLYDFEGNVIPMGEGFEDFLVNLNQKFPDKKMALNAVDQFQQEKILNAPVDFAYTEVWGRNQYQDLVQVILENYEYSNGELNTVLAAYMNYDAHGGTFNSPGVLLTDAVIFAFGGSHLELGEHMLSSEYFPNTKLTMEPQLETSLKEYYDFMVAYQNLLRDGGTFNNPTVRSTDDDVRINNWPPVFARTAAVGKELEHSQVVHLLNFDGVSTLQWKDNNRVQTVPNVKDNFSVSIQAERNVSRVWFASPDLDGGASTDLEFTQNGNEINVEVPYLKYWSMIVLEY
jgi:dextranase